MESSVDHSVGKGWHPTLLGGVSLAASFQAIVDLWATEVHAYEVLTRPTRGGGGIARYLGIADRAGMRWEAEQACRRTFFRTIENVRLVPPTTSFFLNVSPCVFLDPRFTPELLRAEGLGRVVEEGRLVIELTEGEPMACMDRLRGQRDVFARQGLRVALDDFGGGYNGLSTFRGMPPDWLKLDMDLVRGIETDPAGQVLVRSLCQMARTLEIELVAEGIETQAELRALISLGVRYGQGYLLQRPGPTPDPLGKQERMMVRELLASTHKETGAEEQAQSAVQPARVIEPGTVRGVELDEMFRSEPALDHVVLAQSKRPIGLITRNHYYQCASGHFGFPLIQKRWVDAAADRQALVIDGRTDLAMAARMAMSRCSERIYDPVIVLDQDGELMGTMTIKALLGRSTELRVNSAMSANPLTGLPGNTVIERWLEDCVERREFTVVYADLDQFKAYNDTYGFAMGDEMIRLQARVLVEMAGRIPGNVHVGHVGGDDLVLVADCRIPAEELAEACRHFDARRLPLFRTTHRHEGGYEVQDRRGRKTFCRLVTLSLAVVHSEAFSEVRPHRARLAAIAAMLKKRLKEDEERAGRSAYLCERRVYSR
jgi:EAL domain-containing protein (putative c-di-GMP-specific phosphodiesterase class I)/GGDEF domain-containing protein